MMLFSRTREFAHRLLAYEALAVEASASTGSATHCVYEKLRRLLSALAGVGGFQSIASRALTLAKAEAPSLRKIQLAEDGCLHGPSECESLGDKDPDAEAGVILIAELIGLLFTFIGEALTLRLMQDVWPEITFDDDSSGMGGKRE